MSAPGPHRASGGRSLPAFDKSRVTIPDRVTSDTDNAVVSSEDENEAVKSVASLAGQPGAPAQIKGPRRSSFLSELQPGTGRKMSFSGLTFPAPPTGSQPSTPSTDNNPSPWAVGSGLARVPSNGSTTAWTNVNSIWKDFSPGQPIAPTRSHGDGPFKPNSPQGANEKDLLPFSIPLQPTPKTYRSASYSVGQLDNELGAAAAARPNTASVKHKPSRLNEVEHAPTLDEVHEGDDEGSDAGVPLGSPRLYNAHIYASFTSANPTLARKDSDELLLQHCATLPTTTGLNDSPRAVEQSRADASRNMDEQELQTLGSRLGPHALNNPRTQWQTSLKFDSMQDPSASRRHSLADVPTRRGSLAGDAVPFTHAAAAYTGVQQENGSYQRHAADLEDNMVQSDLHNRAYAHNYFSGTAPAVRSRMESAQGHSEFAANRTPGQYRQGPPSGVFTRPGYDTLLYLVAFKCARADIYYVQPGTGLDVNEGDLVMVEADRGYDLGTVTHARVSWARARELKEKALDEHFRWLMMFSRHNQELAGTEPQAMHGLMAQKGPRERDPLRKAREGIGLGMHDVAYNHDIKPRMIKRRAFNHEIANLREKEGNEAKAKRSCQQKAREHGCQMEILDAEFQIDWKKLTFYFYAEDYVNFNALVTDLYKVYKVRIWMSAINPNTYPSPANKPPSAIGPGAMEGRDTPMGQTISSFNDPDPDGAVPPALNPNSDTFKVMQKEADARGYGRGSVADPIPDAFSSRWGPEGQATFPRTSEQQPSSNLQPPGNGQSAPLGGFGFGTTFEASRTASNLPFFGNGHINGQAASGASFNPAGASFNPAGASLNPAGASFNPAVSRPSPVQQAFNPYAPTNAPTNAPSSSFQPWNSPSAYPTESSRSHLRGLNPLGLNPLSHPANYGQDWQRGFANLNLGQNDKK